MTQTKIGRFVTQDKEAIRRYEKDLASLGWTFVPCSSELDYAHHELSRLTEEKAGLVIFRGMGLQPSSEYRSTRGNGNIFTSENTQNWLYSNVKLIENLIQVNPAVFPKHAIFIANPAHLEREPLFSVRCLGLNTVIDAPDGKDAGRAIDNYWSQVLAQEAREGVAA